MAKEELVKEAEEKAGIYFDSLETMYGDMDDTSYTGYQVIKAYEKGVLDFAEPREKRIADLEKENAELKEQLFSLRNERDTFLAQNEQYEKDLIDFNENLTKAKELLEKLLLVSCNSDVLNQYPNCSEVLQARVEAEHFLSEVEK